MCATFKNQKDAQRRSESSRTCFVANRCIFGELRLAEVTTFCYFATTHQKLVNSTRHSACNFSTQICFFASKLVGCTSHMGTPVVTPTWPTEGMHSTTRTTGQRAHSFLGTLLLQHPVVLTSTRNQDNVALLTTMCSDIMNAQHGRALQ